MTVLGIDPSLACTGVATPTALFTIPTKPGDPDRLATIYHRVSNVTEGVELAVLEDLPTHAHGAGLTGMAQGVVRLALLHAGVPFVAVAPATVKKYATGSGGANKADMRMAWYQRTGDDVRDDNKVDALWLRQIGLTLTDSPDAIAVPKLQRDVLQKVVLP